MCQTFVLEPAFIIVIHLLFYQVELSYDSCFSFLSVLPELLLLFVSIFSCFLLYIFPYLGFDRPIGYFLNFLCFQKEFYVCPHITHYHETVSLMLPISLAVFFLQFFSSVLVSGCIYSCSFPNTLQLHCHIALNLNWLLSMVSDTIKHLIMPLM
jgi:hypothetical protein